MNNGFITIHRKILDNAISSKPNYFSVWMYILLQANHKPRDIIVNGQKMTINRGEHFGSLYKISHHFNLSIASVKKIIDYLEKDKMVKTKRTNKYTIFQILNYDQYQDSKNKVKPKRKQSETNNNDNNENNENKTIYNLSDGIDNDLFNDYILNRKQMKKPMTELAIQKAINKINLFKKKGYDCNAIIETTIINGWQDFYEPKPQNGTHKQAPRTSSKSFAEARGEK